MNRAQQLQFCKVCKNRKMDFEQGLICSLTEKRADFSIECKDYIEDEVVKRLDHEKEVNLEKSDLERKLSPELFEQVKSEQNLTRGVIFGFAAGLFGAIFWAIFTVATKFQIGFMAIAIGAIVGLAVRKFGNGIDSVFGFWGAAIALLSCILGNFFSMVGLIAEEVGQSFFDILFRFNYELIFAVMKETFKPMDLFFYGLAIFEAYKFSFREITENSIKNISNDV
jgi:hypothetical protein